MNNNKSKYTLGFTSGSLLFKEAEAYISCIKDEEEFINGNEEIDKSVLLINAESSQKRIKHELDNRLKGLQNHELIQQYKTSDETNKKLILFYAACKLYPLITDFLLEIVLNKWYNMDFELSTDDFQNFLYRKMDTHPELFDITEGTQYKLSQVALKMLKDLGLLKNNILQKIEFNHNLLKSISLNGDNWFLEVILLNELERKEIIEG